MKKILFALCFSGVLFSCSSDDEKPALSIYQNEVITYFQEIALGFEFGSATEVTRKWQSEMKIFIGGTPDTELSNELQSIITEINTLATDGFEITITPDSLASNCYIFFGSASEFVSRYQPASSSVGNNWGLFFVFFDGGNRLYRALIFIDIHRANESEQMHLLREELTQSLGLAKDSPRYSESIFQQSWTTTTSYSPIDRDLIRLLYHPGMFTGLTRETSHEVLTQLVRELDI
jgi:hypothetical protein